MANTYTQLSNPHNIIDVFVILLNVDYLRLTSIKNRQLFMMLFRYDIFDAVELKIITRLTNFEIFLLTLHFKDLFVIN